MPWAMDCSSGATMERRVEIRRQQRQRELLLGDAILRRGCRPDVNQDSSRPLARLRTLYSDKTMALLPSLFIGLALWAGGTTHPALDVWIATVAPDEYGRWARLPREDWPPIALINQVTYTDKHHPVAACGFLVDTGDEVLAATAKHVLTYFKSKSMQSVSFNGTLKSWKMYPKDRPADVVVIDRLINENPKEPLDRIPSGRDWLLFTIQDRPPEIQPLRFRTTPLRPGETVFVIGWRYTDEGRQWVREGKFVRRDEDDGNSILISVEELTDNTVPGLSGSPVIDVRGYVIGLMSKKAGKLQRLAPADYPLTVVRERKTAGVPQE